MDSIKGKRARESLQENAAAVRLSKELVTIKTELPVELDLEALGVVEPDREKLRDLFVELEFHSLAKELGAPEQLPTRLARNYGLADTVEAVTAVIEAVRRTGRMGLALEATSPDPMRGEIIGMGLASEPGDAWYLPFRQRRPGVLDLEGVQVRNLPALDAPAMRPLVELLEAADVACTGHDLKTALLLLRRAGVSLRGIAFDTEVASYVADPGRRDHVLTSLALQHFGVRRHARDEITGKGRTQVPLEEVDVETVRDWVAEAADLALRLRAVLEAELEAAHLEPLYRDIEMPLMPVLADMEYAGIRIDAAFFRQQSVKLERELRMIEEEICKEAGEEFNINSTPQLRTILFEKLELPTKRKTKTGASTDASVLEELAAAGHTLPRLILEFRQLDKLRSTYVDALPQQVDPVTGRIHTRFSQVVAATGRLSSSDPNLQNIPIRTQVGAELRKGFVPADGCLFLGADYSQIELRILAHMSGDAVMTRAFKEGIDVHRQTAALIFGVDIEQVSADMRAAAKTVNFATIYGIGPFSLSQQLGTSTAEAKAFIAQYFERLPGVRRYLDEQIEKAKKDGWVETLSGRRRYIPELRSPNWNLRQFGERAATNAPVQGTAADIIKVAMIRIQAALAEGSPGTRMLLQVHDELLFEVPRAEIENVRALVKDRMENAFPLDVPLEVATGVGESWYECK